MPINNITQTISTIPPAGARGVDVQTIFVIKQEDFQDHLQGITVTELNTLKTQMNTMSGEMNTTASQVNTDASTATTKAEEASSSASSASTSASTATTQAGIATNASTKASKWADNAYNVEVETGKYSAKHWSTVAQNATSGKIDKVTSTDNAVVRFDGTTGAVQNSGVTIDDNGNVGIGVTPSAWYGGKHLQTNYSAFGENYAGHADIQSNSYEYSNNAYKYIVSGVGASRYTVNLGNHTWFVAPSGTAGNAITWTNPMGLGASGNLLIGTTSDNGVDKLQVNGSISSGAIQQCVYGDLNNFKYITQTIGTYPSGYMSNIPINDHGYLEIIVYGANVNVMQRFTTLGILQTAGRVFVRCLSDGTWTGWVEK